MNGKPWSVEEREYLRSHYGSIPAREIAETLRRSLMSVYTAARDSGLRKRQPAKRKPWSAEDHDYLRRAYADTSTREIAATLGRTLTTVYQQARALGLEKSEAYLASPAACRLRRGDNIGAAYRFKPGQVPANKGLRRPGWSPGRMKETQFKKGVRGGVAEKLWKPIGTERISKDGYLERKINNDLPLQRRWRAVHLILWEEAHGPLPAGYAVAFKNGDKSDIRLDNLELITRAELMQRNTIHHLPTELKEVIHLKGRLLRRIRRKEKADAEKQAGRSAESPLRDDRALER
jgi:hypothetical protein